MERLANFAYLTVTTRFHELREADRERGLTTTEIAVLTFILVATAVAIGALLYSYAEGRVAALPDDTTPASIPTGG
jgi:hypothetical protein